MKAKDMFRSFVAVVADSFNYWWHVAERAMVTVPITLFWLGFAYLLASPMSAGETWAAFGAAMRSDPAAVGHFAGALVFSVTAVVVLLQIVFFPPRISSLPPAAVTHMPMHASKG